MSGCLDLEKKTKRKKKVKKFQELFFLANSFILFWNAAWQTLFSKYHTLGWLTYERGSGT